MLTGRSKRGPGAERTFAGADIVLEKPVSLGTLRQARADHRSAGRLTADDDTIRDARWSYAGRGWPTAAIAEQAAGIVVSDA